MVPHPVFICQIWPPYLVSKSLSIISSSLKEPWGGKTKELMNKTERRDNPHRWPSGECCSATHKIESIKTKKVSSGTHRKVRIEKEYTVAVLCGKA